jgi:hypothetical protein
MKGFTVFHRTVYTAPYCECDKTKYIVILPEDQKTLCQVCLKCEFNYDRALFYEEAVIPCFKDYKDDIARARAYTFWALRPKLSRDIATKIAQLYEANPYDGWTTADYQKWRKATGRIPGVTTIPKKTRRHQQQMVDTASGIISLGCLLFLWLVYYIMKSIILMIF